MWYLKRSVLGASLALYLTQGEGVASRCIVTYHRIGAAGVPTPGALKTEQTTHAMFRLLRDALNNRRIMFHYLMQVLGGVLVECHLVSPPPPSPPQSPTKGTSAEEYIRQLCMELRRMRIERNRKLVNGVPSESYILTGKGKSLSDNDDCAVALAMAAYYPVLWRSEART